MPRCIVSNILVSGCEAGTKLFSPQLFRCLLQTWTWFPDLGCLLWLCLNLTLQIPRWSQAPEALTLGFSLSLSKIVTSHTLSWGHLGSLSNHCSLQHLLLYFTGMFLYGGLWNHPWSSCLCRFRYSHVLTWDFARKHCLPSLSFSWKSLSLLSVWLHFLLQILAGTQGLTSLLLFSSLLYSNV